MSAMRSPRAPRSALFVPCSTAGAFPGDASAQRRLLALAGFPDLDTLPSFCCGHLRRHGPPSVALRYAPDVWVDAIRSRSTLARIPIHLHRPCHDVWDDERWGAYRRWVEETAAVDVIETPFRDPCCGFGGVFSTLFDRTAAAMMDHRLAVLGEAGAKAIVSAEPGCLGHFAAHARDLAVVPLATFLVSRGIAA